MKIIALVLAALLLAAAGLGLKSHLVAQRETTELKAKQDEMTVLQSRLEAEAKSGNAKVELEETKTELAKVEDHAMKNLSAQQDRITALEQELAQGQKDQQTAVMAEQTTLAASLTNAQVQTAQLQAQNAALTTQIAQLQAQFAAAKDREVRDATADLRQQLAAVQQQLAVLQRQPAPQNQTADQPSPTVVVVGSVGNPHGTGLDTLFLVVQKIFSPPTVVKVGPTNRQVPASWALVLQGVQTGITFPAVAVTQPVFNSVTAGQTCARGVLPIQLP